MNGSTASQSMAPSPRRLWYAGLFLSSLVATGSTLEAVQTQRRIAPPTATERWAVGSIVTVFLLTFASLALLSTPRTARLIFGTKLELVLILVLAACTCAAAGTATNPATGMAVNANGGVSFGNLYYSTWASFACCMGLLLSFMRTERGLDVSSELQSRGRRFRLWVILIVTNLIDMGSSASAYDAKCGEDEEMIPIKYCRRSAFGVSAGCIGCVGSLAVVAMRLTCTKHENGEARPNKFVFGVECISAAVLLSFFCFALAYLTSETGPGAPLGNIFYSTWISFGLIFFVGASCFEEVQAAKSIYKQRSQQGGGDASEGEVSSILLSNPRRHAYDENIAPIDFHLSEQIMNGVQQDYALPVGKRSGSIGEVSIQ